MQGDVAVVVELAERDPKPVGRADLDDRVNSEREQLALADPGAGQQFHDQAREWVRVGAAGAHELGGCGIVEESRQGLVDDRQVAGEDQRPLRWVGVTHSVTRSKKQCRLIRRFLMLTRFRGLPV